MGEGGAHRYIHNLGGGRDPKCEWHSHHHEGGREGSIG